MRYWFVALVVAAAALFVSPFASAQVGPGPFTLVAPYANTFNGAATPSPIPSLVPSPIAISTAAGGHLLLHLGIENNTAATVYIQLYNLAPGSVTPGTTIPVYELICPTGTQQCVFPLPWFGWPMSNSTGFSVGATTTSVFSGGTTSPGAGVTAFPLYR